MNINSKLDSKQKVIITVSSVLLFATLMVVFKKASDFGDKYFPKDRFDADNFWTWIPK